MLILILVFREVYELLHLRAVYPEKEYIHWLLSSIGQIFCPQGTDFPILLVCASRGFRVDPQYLQPQLGQWGSQRALDIDLGKGSSQTHGDKPHHRMFQRKLRPRRRLIKYEINSTSLSFISLSYICFGSFQRFCTNIIVLLYCIFPSI